MHSYAQTVSCHSFSGRVTAVSGVYLLLVHAVTGDDGHVLVVQAPGMSRLSLARGFIALLRVPRFCQLSDFS